jgi:hypothetical protein
MKRYLGMSGASRARSSEWAAIVVVVLLAGAAAVYLVENGGSQAASTYTLSSAATSTSAQSPVSGLELSLTLNTTNVSAGHGLIATVDATNAKDAPANVSAAADWPVQGLAVSTCGSLNYPVGLAVLKGNYDLSNVTSGKALQIYQPGLSSCPMILAGIEGFVFQASSDNATLYGSCQPGGGACLNERINSSVSVAGYWSGSVFKSFPIGIYTVVAGDEWGGLAILHFAVA